MFSNQRMDASTLVIVLVCCGFCCLFSMFFLYRKYIQFLKRRELLEHRKKWKSTHRNTLTGNFVVTYHVPIEEAYIIEDEKILGKGSFGVVVHGTHRETKEEYAIKFVNTESGKRTRIEREYKLLKDIDHPNIVRLFAVYDTDVSVRIILSIIIGLTYFAQVGFVMELCTGGHLGTWMDSVKIETSYGTGIPEQSSKNIIRQLLSAAANMHARGICHR